MIVPAVGSAVAAAGLAAYGAFHRNSGLFGNVITRVSRTGNTVSITFDDGPNPYATPAILDALAKHNVKATFFILGRHAERWPELVARAAAEGHQIGNHGYYHRKLHLKSPSYIRDDLARGKRAIEAAGGGTPQLFRAPHGFRNPWVTHIARTLGERTVGWSLGVWDSDRPGANAIAERALKGMNPGSILLLHDGDGYDPLGDRVQTAQALPKIIAGLRARGYTFSTLPV
jgi:peptidoglycan/xylan/chitin deacetylase (PgdA/CDA1 family)